MKIPIFVPADRSNDENYRRLETSFWKFHSKDKYELLRFDNPTKDMNFWYKAKPYLAKFLMEQGHEVVAGFDADQIILGNLDHIFEGDYDVATVLNDPTYPIGVWDIPQPYYNNGLVVMKSKKFVDHWDRLCNSDHFLHYQFREQDLLNLLCSDYFDYKVNCLDFGDKIHGEFAKPVWTQAVLEDDKVMIENRQLCVIHFGGGAGDPSKGNFKLRFKPEVSRHIERLIK